MSDKQGAPTLPPLTGGGGNNGGSNGGAPQQTVSLQQVFANVLTSANVQQFVLASQVPGLAQVLPSSGTTNQPIGVTRIVNISGTTPRVSMVNVAATSGQTGSGAALTSPTRQNPKLVLTTSPKLVRTSIGNMFVAPTSQASSTVQSPPAKKKLRLSEGTEKPTAVESDAMGYRRRIMEHKLKRMRGLREKHNDNVSELFFLHNGGNLMDYHIWKKRPPTAQYQLFMQQQRLEADDDEEDLLQNTTTTKAMTAAGSTTGEVNTTAAAASATTTAAATLVTTITSTATTTMTAATVTASTTTSTSESPNVATSATATANQNTEVTVSGVGSTPVAVSTTLPPAVAQLSQQDSAKSTSVPVGILAADKTLTANPVEKPATPPVTSAQPIVKLVKLPASSIASPCDTISNQEQIVEKAKQEAYVMQRIAELQREGLWSEKRLPKVQEPQRPKAHWDYLLEEMLWLSTDFAQERKWKKSAAKKCARMVQKYFQEKAIQAQKAEKLEELRLKKIAGFIAKEIKTFWANVEKLVEYKQQTRLEEKRKKALDQHLNFIVDQTEKYSSWLTEGLNKTEGTQSTPASMHSSRISSPVTAGKQSDDDFKPSQCSDDDEETIAKAEEEMKSNHKEEVELLKKESELPLEDLLKELPPNYLEERDKDLSPSSREIVEEESDNNEGKDTEFTVASDESSDDEEDTIQEQEKLEKNVDHKQELDDLKAENEMSIEELMAKYGNASETPMNVDDTEEESDKCEEEEEDESESENETESEDETQDDSQTQSDEETNVGLKSLLEDLSDENKSINETAEKQNEMDSVAALAESIQPKGNTLLTTSVVTKIPFLLKHCLREYQHIGLDWLVTMFERKLNGILADEMGLGKTIQTIALLAHLACEKGNWGPHLIIVPTSVMLNWEMECKKWCPGFKILTYYGTQKERKQKRTGWTKPNAFHICITSYKLVIQDHQSFRRKKWKYLILDEAQNIKNFKSQRWQLLLNFQTQRRLLLTGTPLQNNLMELWSLMHFLMPNVFQSHREFKEWFSNPVTGMIEGNNEYNENIIRRLHKVLRPFLLRRLKCEVEKQLPKKYEHILMCRLSKRQRYLYDDFMSRAKTKETLACGNLLSVINVLMQLRKVCNHPNLFEPRPTISPFQMEGIQFHTASLAWTPLDYDPFQHVDLSFLNLRLVDLEFVLTAFVAHRIKRFKTPRKLIEEIDSQPEPPLRCPSGKIKINVRLSNQVSKATTATQQSPQQIKIKSFPGILPTPRVEATPMVKTVNSQTPTGQGVTLKVATGQQLQGFSVQLVPHQGGVKAIPVGTVAQNIQSTATVTPTTTGINAQRITVANANTKDGPQRLTTHTYTVKHGDSVQKYQVPSFAQLVQTSTGRHIILTNPNQQTTNALSFPVMTSTGQRLTVLSKQIMGLSTTPVSVNKVIGGVVTSTAGGISGRPVMRVPPLNVNTSQAAGQIQSQTQIRCGVVTRNTQKDSEKNQTKETPKSEFYLAQLEETRRQRRQAKLTTLADINERRCDACPLYGEDLFTALRIRKPATGCQWHAGWLHCATNNEPARTRRQYFSRTEALAQAITSTEQIVEELKSVLEKFVVYVPAVQSSLPRFHVSHPPPHKLWGEQRMELELQHHLSPKMALFHPVMRSMSTQFPDVRLIQYDCGKLQSLDMLLRQLKSGNHRVLIFTQMTRMLDVLEAFLNYHGYIYLRLDGTTKVDQRQVLMERFNNDKRIFCFILSTRSGGIGVNLTGADTVVFYDSDWNPTMDAQAQDRCHRIGQTRDVHIYRLISERTVEENILKKANQKRLLGDLAIEGGNFTTAYFKSSTIQDIFNVDNSETDASMRMAEVLDQNKDREKHLQKEVSPPEDKMAIGALESALAAVEEDLDVQAAKTAKAEAVADLAEFDENIPVDDADNEDGQISKAEMEVQNIVSQLTPVERYAMRFVEESDGNFSAAQLAAAERELEEQKKEWERDRLRALREEEERQMRMTDDDENPLTFTREDAQNQVNNSTSNSRRVVHKRPARPGNKGRRGRQVAAAARSTRRRGSRRSTRVRDEKEASTTTSSDSDSETMTLTDTDSRDDDVAVERDESSGEERKSSRADSFDADANDNEEDEEDEEEDEDNEVEAEDGKHEPPRRHFSSKGGLLNKTKKNHFDLNSPRTRSRGNVKINLWTLDVSPILPESKHRFRTKKSKSNSATDNMDESSVLLDNKTRTLSEPMDASATKAADISLNSSADESNVDEDEGELNESESNTLETRTNKRSTLRSVVKMNTQLSEKEIVTDSFETSINESKSVHFNTADGVTASNQGVPNTGSKDTSCSTNRPGRPKKILQSSSTAAPEQNASVTYSTRSSNKLSLVSPLQDKRTTIKVNCKEESEICDINDTLNPQNNENEKGKSGDNAASKEVTILRPNDARVESETCKSNEKYDNTQQLQESSSLKANNPIPKSLSIDEIRSSSPILSIRRLKITRSYARNRTELKEILSVAEIDSDVPESKQSKPSDKVLRSSTANEQLGTPMEVDDSPPVKSNDDDTTISNEMASPHRSSPILRHAKVKRISVRPSDETKEKETSPESALETKKIDANAEKKADEAKVSDNTKTLIEPILTVVMEPENSSLKGANEESRAELKIKITRSSVRSIPDTKPKAKSSSPSNTNLDQENLSNAKTKDCETSASVAELEKSNIKKEPQPQVQIKLTRSSLRTSADANAKSSSIELVKSTFEKPKSPNRQSILQSTEQVTMDETPAEKRQQSSVSVDDTDSSIQETSRAELQKLKISKSIKIDTGASNVTTRRSKANCNIQSASETNDNIEEKTSIVNTNESSNEKTDAPNSKAETGKITGASDDTKTKQLPIIKSIVQLTNPFCRRLQTLSKPILRRRPDTPMPVFHSIRPTTRSLTINNNSSSSSDSEGSSSTSPSQQKRGSRTTMNNGFLVPSSPPVTVRRSRSTTYIKMSERLAMDRKEIVVPVGPTKVLPESLANNRLLAKRRPDTPLPTPEQFSRATRSNVDLFTPSPRSLPPIPKMKQLRRGVAVSRSLHPPSNQFAEHEGDSTDSNGNSLDSDVESTSYNKPQRTAKVVAILSLDSKGIGKSTASVAAQQRMRQSNAVAGKGSQTNSVEAPSLITMVDLDDEPEYTSTDVSKRTKRTRLNSNHTAKPVTGCKPSATKEVQMVELEDDEEDKIPTKRSNRCNPPSSAVASPPDNLNNNPVS